MTQRDRIVSLYRGELDGISSEEAISLHNAVLAILPDHASVDPRLTADGTGASQTSAPISRSVTGGSPATVVHESSLIGGRFPTRLVIRGLIAASVLAMVGVWWGYSTLHDRQDKLVAEIAQLKTQAALRERDALVEAVFPLPTSLRSGRVAFGSRNPSKDVAAVQSSDPFPGPDLNYGTIQYYSDRQFALLNQWIARQSQLSQSEKQLWMQYYAQRNDENKRWALWWYQQTQQSGQTGQPR